MNRKTIALIVLVVGIALLPARTAAATTVNACNLLAAAVHDDIY